MQPLLGGGFICGQQNMKPQSKLKLELSLSVVNMGCGNYAQRLCALGCMGSSICMADRNLYYAQNSPC